MEVVGVAASAVTLFGVAVKGTEALYNTISGFRNVSLRTESLGSAVRNLRALLTQLENNDAIAEDTLALKEFRDLLKDYDVDIRRHENDLRRIQSNPLDSKTKRLSKKLKGAISGDKDLLRILAELTQCCTVLGTRLNLLLCNTTLTLRNNVLDLRMASSARAVHDVSQSKLLLEQSVNVSAIHGNMENVTTSMDEIHEAVITMTQRMERMPQVSDKQNNDIRNLLLALQDQISGLSNSSTGSRNASQSASTHSSEDDERAGKESELKRSIESLQSLASQKEGNVHGEQAESIITDLEYILKIVSASADNRHITPPKRNFEAFSATEDIDPRSKPVANGKVSQKRKTKIVTAREYDVIVELSQRTFSDSNGDQNQDTDRSSMIETITRVKVLENSEYPTMLVAYLRHVQAHNGFSTLNPVISIGKILPDDSSLFAIVSHGDVDGLKRLLLQRQCTLRDRDSFGTPLLHYAMTQPSMCKFLIEHGADVDEIASVSHEREFQYPPLLSKIHNDVDEEDDHLQAIIECRRLLLQAGADPTIRDSGDKTTLMECASSGTVDSLRAVLDLGVPFINLEDKNEHGQTALLLAAMNFAYGSDVMFIKLLLERGANIHARDHLGRTCLHHAAGTFRRPDRLELDVAVLVLLIEHHADIFATDYRGRSIFAHAYECDHERLPMGGYRGDLWDAVLVRCGYSMYIRSVRTRVCHFTERYTQEHFARLWKGREHECPYFSDPPRFCLHPNPAHYNTNWTSVRKDEAYIEELSASKITEEEEEEGEKDEELYLTDSEWDQSDTEYSGGIIIS
ncbi:ankyrin [Melanomma pulvis-pyrius CBS 109.77]|uniref:Ankyrin n=1 Tax=Melanomma pulvis-pyrius CBS 109.77 TaxID=1314802 RepID=A0A6A6WPJ2_9PLEO|nr:ankyrin [Melanomma pulvis-pyrius CBS 109.77]